MLYTHNRIINPHKGTFMFTLTHVLYIHC